MERDSLSSTEETEVQKEIKSDRHDGLQTAEAKAHHYDVMVDAF